MNRNIGISIIALFVLGIVSCKKDGNDTYALPIPKGFPMPDIPADNEPTESRVSLGQKLFNDPILSRNNTIACGSCHKEELKMTDALALSVGIDGRVTTRNSMSLLNVAYQPSMFWDGGVPTLEQQVLAPIENHNEMDFDVNLVVERLQQHPEYPQLFQEAYGQMPSVYSLTRAIACFERTLYTGISRYDEYRYYKNDILTESEKKGMDIFFGEKGECFHCHTGYNFTDYSFKNNGLYVTYADSGRAHITQNPSDVGKFKVPSLRNIALTAPYMHDGSINTLEEVIAHYASGGKPHPNKSGLIVPLSLTAQDKQDLLHFLQALSDQ